MDVEIKVSLRLGDWGWMPTLSGAATNFLPSHLSTVKNVSLVVRTETHRTEHSMGPDDMIE